MAFCDSEMKIVSAGFQVRTPAAPVGELPTPGNLAATAGDNDGKVDLAWNAVAGASSYEVECKINTDAGTWQAVKTVTASRLTVEKPHARHRLRLPRPRRRRCRPRPVV
jgi:hypothetical protein